MEAPEAAVKSLTNYLKSAMPTVKSFSQDWPSPSENLITPAITILTGEPNFVQAHPYVISKGTKKDLKTKKYPIFNCIGNYDMILKVHLWADSKPQRNSLYADFLLAMNPETRSSALRLQLTDYFNEWATFDMEKITVLDSEEQAQRSERRIVVNVAVNVRAVVQRADYLIETIENTLSTPDSIPDTSNGGGGSPII